GPAREWNPRGSCDSVRRCRPGLVSAVKALRLYPLDPGCDQLILRAACEAKDLSAARMQLDRALVAKDTAPVRVAAGEIALRSGDTASASAHAARAFQLAPSDPEVSQLLAAIAKG